MKKNRIIWLFALLLTLGLQSCRKDKMPLKEETEQIFEGDLNASPKGLYILNEGNMNANKASLDYVDFTAGIYKRNIYGTVNPEVTLGLGDVGNDIAIYGSKMYVVVNVSNKVEVLDARTGKKIKHIELLNGRYIAVNNGKVYVSAYLGKIGDPNSPQGIVAEIDTVSLSISRKVDVGRQPEEMAILDNKLYVANSGGYSPQNYESTVSVIDLNTFTETKKIEVAINLHRLKADAYGDLYVSSRGDFYDIPAKLFVLDTKTDQIKKTFDIAVSDMVIHEDKAYICGTEWSYIKGENVVTYNTIDVKDETVLHQSFITDGTQSKIILPYGITINPQTGDIFITDAKDYLNPGEIYCFNKAGKLKWSVATGDIPSRFAFIY